MYKEQLNSCYESKNRGSLSSSRKENAEFEILLTKLFHKQQSWTKDYWAKDERNTRKIMDVKVASFFQYLKNQSSDQLLLYH